MKWLSLMILIGCGTDSETPVLVGQDEEVEPVHNEADHSTDEFGQQDPEAQPLDGMWMASFADAQTGEQLLTGGIILQTDDDGTEVTLFMGAGGEPIVYGSGDLDGDTTNWGISGEFMDARHGIDPVEYGTYHSLALSSGAPEQETIDSANYDMITGTVELDMYCDVITNDCRASFALDFEAIRTDENVDDMLSSLRSNMGYPEEYTP